MSRETVDIWKSQLNMNLNENTLEGQNKKFKKPREYMPKIKLLKRNLLFYSHNFILKIVCVCACVCVCEWVSVRSNDAQIWNAKTSTISHSLSSDQHVYNKANFYKASEHAKFKIIFKSNNKIILYKKVNKEKEKI